MINMRIKKLSKLSSKNLKLFIFKVKLHLKDANPYSLVSNVDIAKKDYVYDINNSDKHCYFITSIHLRNTKNSTKKFI